MHANRAAHRTAVLLLAALSVQPLYAQIPATAESLEAARREVSRSAADRDRAMAESKKACDEAETAIDALLREGVTPSAVTQMLAKTARAKRELCSDWKQEVSKAQARVETARARLPDVAASAVPAASMPTAASTPTTGSLVIPTDKDLKAALAEAAAAQERVGKERAAAQGVYDTVDRATKAAYALTATHDSAWTTKAAELQDIADKTKKAGSDAQKAATGLIAKTLPIKGCQLSGATNCATVHALDYEDAKKLVAALDQHLAASEAGRKALLDTAAKVEIAGIWTSEPQRTRALALTKIIEKYPDASAPFADEGFSMLASNKDKSASIRLGMPRLLPGGWREFSVLASAPFGDRVISYVDGLTGLPKLGISYRQGDLGRLFRNERFLQSWALGARLGYDKRSYYEEGPALPKAKTEVRVSPWEVWASLIVLDTTAKSPNSHVFRAGWQRSFNDAPTLNKCPSGVGGDLVAVQCVTGPFGAPRLQESALFSYQYRIQGDKFALSPTATHNTRSEVTEVSLPIYFIADSDNAKRPLNAGIRIDWTSKGKQSITGAIKNSWGFGVFVGSSFSLFSRAE